MNKFRLVMNNIIVNMKKKVDLFIQYKMVIIIYIKHKIKLIILFKIIMNILYKIKLFIL